VKVSQNHRLCAAARLEIDDVVGENKPAIGSRPTHTRRAVAQQTVIAIISQRGSQRFQNRWVDYSLLSQITVTAHLHRVLVHVFVV
jgi:hypothetical protein